MHQEIYSIMIMVAGQYVLRQIITTIYLKGRKVYDYDDKMWVFRTTRDI